MRPAAITAAIVSLGLLIWRIATWDCCPHADLGDDEFGPDECNGSGDCDVSVHVHGCYSDLGECDEPDEHADTMPNPYDLLGIAPDWTCGLSVDEYMRAQRER